MSEQVLVNFRIEVELKDRLEAQADIEHRTVSGLIRHVILNYLEENENAGKKRKR